MNPLNKTIPIPLHYQLYQELRRLLDKGKLRPEDRIPSESELCTTYGVSRTVVRQALGQLEREGRIHKIQGKGAFVTLNVVPVRFVHRLEGLYEDMARLGIRVESKVLTNQVRECPAEIAEKLEMRPGDLVVQLCRLRYVDLKPIVYVTTWIHASLCPGLQRLDLRHVSLYQTLAQKYALVLASGRRLITAIAANSAVAKLLQVRKGSPLVHVEGVSYLRNGVPMEYYSAYYRPDRAVVEVEAVPETAPARAIHE